MSISDIGATTGVAELTAKPIINTLLEQLPVGVLVAGRDGQIEYLNATASAQLDERRRAREPMDIGSVSPATQSAKLGPLSWIIARALLTGELVRDEEVEYLGAHDEWRTFSVSATPIRDMEGEIEFVVVSFADVTLRNRARDWEPVMRSLSRL